MHVTDPAIRPRTVTLPGRAAANVEALARINAEAVAEALGLRPASPQFRLVVALALRRTRLFARDLATFDQRVALHGLQAGSRWLLNRFIGRLETSGTEHIPAEGPLILLSNHPGLSDTLALFASIQRADLRVVAADRPFLRAMPAVSERLLYLADPPSGRLTTIRSIGTHLQHGGALLTFPAGAIEPDPALRPESAATLANWEDRLTLLLRLAREATVLPVLVSGVLSPAAQRHPLTRLRRRQADREWLGATLQMLWPHYQRVRVRVQIGTPIPAAALPPTATCQAIIASMRTLITQVHDARRREGD